MDEADDQRLILKILSGPHLGAEVGLTAGRITVGRASDCDLVLNDRSVAPHHASVTVDENGCHVAPLDGTVLVSGSPIDDATTLEMFQVVTLGTTNFSIGRDGEAWPDVLVPSSAAAPAEEAEPAPEPKAAAAASTETAGATPAERKRRGHLVLWVGLPALVLIVVAALVVAVWPFGASDAPPGDPLAPQAHLQAVQGAIDDYKLTEVKAEIGAQDQIIITGYISSVDDWEKFKSALDSIQGKEELDAWVVQRMVTAVQTALSAQNFDVVASYKEAGIVILEGIVPWSTKFDQAMEELRNDVPGIQDFDDRTIDSDALLSHLGELLQKFNLESKLNLKELDSGDILATGSLTTDEVDQWDKAQSYFFDQHGRVLAFQSDITIIGDGTPDSLPIDISGLKAGADGFITDTGGTRYDIGSILPDGSKVVAISASAITLEKNGITMDHDVPSNVQWVVEDGDGG